MSDTPRHAAEPTQVRRPWHATLRTVVAVVVALAAMAPAVIAASGLSEGAAVAGVLAVSAAITRVMALPAVDAFLDRWLPWLAADPTTRE